MLLRASSRRAACSKSLLQRLAPLETGLFLPTASCTDRPRFDLPEIHRTYSLRACFGFGFASSCIGGGIAMLILLLVNPVGATVQTVAAAERVSVVSLPQTDPPSMGRQLWWKLPMSEGDGLPSIVADSLPAPRTARLEQDRF
jgi:hypothetical protein